MKHTRRAFYQMVRERGDRLRPLAYDRLMGMKDGPPERVSVGKRSGTIATRCQACDGERVAVVIRGDLDTWFSFIKSISRDGFYKHRDGSITEMSDDEYYDYDPLFDG
jgi:hypothetical protein